MFEKRPLQHLLYVGNASVRTTHCKVKNYALKGNE